MILATLLALAAQSVSADAGEIHAAIFDDLFLNAMIGNGNEEASPDWLSGHDSDRPGEIRIYDLRCNPWFGQRHCRFVLARTSAPQSGEPAGDAGETGRLRCRATFHRPREPGRRHWRVLHFPPGPGGGHSRTSMHCSVVRPR